MKVGGEDGPFLQELRGRLDELEGHGLRRRLIRPAGLDFSSNDYLGLSRRRALAREVARHLDEGAATGAPASRLLRGHTELHERFEARWAAFKGCEAALLFPSGWQANVGLLSAVIGPRDRVLSDRLNHASLIDGLRLSRCSKVIYPHLDLESVERKLATPWPGGRTFLLTESLFSMDGDVAPLGDFARLCARYGAELIVDDAHATGLWGERGSGLVEHFGIADRVLASLGTGGKALGCAGGLVAGPRLLIDFLVNQSRSFIFSTAVSPLVVLGLDAALSVVEAEPDLRARPHRLADRLRGRLAEAGWSTLNSTGPIVPVIVGGNAEAVAAAETLQRAGFDVRAIRPPTVAPGTARLRVSVHSDHTEAQLDALGRQIIQALGDRRRADRLPGDNAPRVGAPTAPPTFSGSPIGEPAIPEPSRGEPTS